MIIIAVDGPSGSGKGTISNYLSQKFNLGYVDSGLLYRYAALIATERSLDLTHLSGDDLKIICEIIAQQNPKDIIDSPVLRLEETANVASQISVHPEIRSCITAWLQDLLHRTDDSTRGFIVDGRDIGTIVFPNADIKFFITASDEVRAMRRSHETDENHLEITSYMQQRDWRDRTRITAPLKTAPDAYIMDTTHLSIDEACQNAAKYVSRVLFNS